MEFILKKIELKRVNFLKRVCSRRTTSFFHSNSRSKHFAAMHSIDEAFVQGGSIKINSKTIVNFNEDRQKKGISRILTKQFNLKRNFFKRIEEIPEEIKKYFRAKLNGHVWKKKFEIALKNRIILKKKISLKN